MSRDPLTPADHMDHAARILATVEAMDDNEPLSREQARDDVALAQAHISLAAAQMMGRGRV